MSKKVVPPVSPLLKSVEILKKRCETIHIKKLRFPNYRNLELGSTIDFEFPITILLGRNGTNKSSVLHALYGSVARNTMADFWFETEIDAIPATINNVKQSVTHSYLDSENNLVESIKARAPRKSADPDYWEPVKPSKVYGFPSGATRVPPIQLKVTHLDLRGELPAFDKYFYFPDKKHIAGLAQYAKKRKTLRRDYRKQDYLRRRSPFLKKQMSANGTTLTPKELKISANSQPIAPAPIIKILSGRLSQERIFLLV